MADCLYVRMWPINRVFTSPDNENIQTFFQHTVWQENSKIAKNDKPLSKVNKTDKKSDEIFRTSASESTMKAVETKKKKL